MLQVVEEDYHYYTAGGDEGAWLPVKRGLDIVFSAALLIVLSPLLLTAAAAIYLSMGYPILFRQMRPGLGGKPFMLLKFRSMRIARRSDGTDMSDGERLTGLGRFLRATSIDELPELWNVLMGDMSLVGPRPLLMEYLPRYSREQARRHDVRPGITGWAQINGRNSLSWEEKFELDVWYVRHHNVLLDFRILVLTIWAVLMRRGISSAGHATMPVFENKARQDDAR